MALSSCAIDPAECRLFLGTINGSLVQLDLYALVCPSKKSTQDVEKKKTILVFQNKTEVSVVVGAENAGNLLLFNGHSTELAWLDVNHDGSLLASGDVSGVYMIWDISSRQCLKTSSLKGMFHEMLIKFSCVSCTYIFQGPICKLKFNTRWKAAEESSKKNQILPIPNLKRQKERKLPAFVLLQDGMFDEKVILFPIYFVRFKNFKASILFIISDNKLV